MYVNNAVLSAQHTINGGGIKPPPSHSSFNFGDMLTNMVDPFGIFQKAQKSTQHFIDTADHVFNRGLDAGENVFDGVADAGENAGKGLKDLTEMITKYFPIVIGGVVILSILK